jgi:hypothetical protein
MSSNAPGLIAKVIETYSGRICYRIGKMIEVVAKKHPEARDALTELAEMVKMFSLVYAPEDPQHPARPDTATAPPVRTFVNPRPWSNPEPAQPLPPEERGVFQFQRKAESEKPKVKTIRVQGRPSPMKGKLSEKTLAVIEMLRAGKPTQEIAKAFGMTVGAVAVIKSTKKEYWQQQEEKVE